MKHALSKTLVLLGLFPFLLSGCSKDPVVGPQGPEGPQGVPGETGPKGEPGQDGKDGVDGIDGKDGTSMRTGHGEPNANLGIAGDSYIDLDSWDFYVKGDNGWAKMGNIKGLDGKDGEDGENGVSIESTYIDENGDLIVCFSNGETTNAGHIKDVDDCTVKFYCGDLLVDTQVVKNGSKVENPSLEDFIVKHWYIDKDLEHEWLWYGCFVTEDMSLYGDYIGVEKNVYLDKATNYSIDEYGYGSTVVNDSEICVSKAVETVDYLTILEDRGILFNKSELGPIHKLNINIADTGFESAKVFYGNTPLSFEKSFDLTPGVNTVDFSEAEYFTIQNTGNDQINIISLNITYETQTLFSDDSLPTVVINTKDSQPVTSRTEYVSCTISTLGADKDLTDLKANIKVRGNSTAQCPKKPYRIKLDKKNSLFGYTKAKNWSLLAEYMDGSNMHNYTALKFAKMVRGENTFGVDPLHVNVTLNGENIGIYTFCEHIDAKEGRLNIEQDNIWEKSFDDINFYIERDGKTLTDPTEIEGTTYFTVDMPGHTPSQYVFALKYPEKEDFQEEMIGGEINEHEQEFNSFFNELKTYIKNICDKFKDYSDGQCDFATIASNVDVESLALYAAVDQTFGETDHGQYSFKMFRSNGGLLQFGPNWDYDSCAFGLPYQGTYLLDPFTIGWNYFQNTYFGEKWGYSLFRDIENGKPLFKSIWNSLSNEEITQFVEAQYKEMANISQSTIYDCEIWMYNQYYAVFDNQQYYWKWVSTQLKYLKDYYS